MKFTLWSKLAKMTLTDWLWVGGAALVAVALVVLLVWLKKQEQPERKKDLRTLLYGAMCMALAFVLSYIKLFSMPMGGSITLASMLPIFLYANRFGLRNGLLCGLAYGLLQFIQKPEIYHPLQILLDYPLAFAALGLAGSVKNLQLGVLFGGVGRFFFHFLSGAVFFATFAPESMSPWWYAFLYNGSYMGAEILLCLVLSFPAARVFDRVLR
ncbi:MAG: energy-coupled thiamine transporter ThiT [Clostridiales bacterium]|nr:energy-coupled thiamine transporter ThiT [Clostridiales bacterium]